MRSQAEPEMTHVLLRDADAKALVDALRKPRNETARELRAGLKKVLK